MLMFMLAISCLNTSSLPWFMDLTFPVPMQYYSLQHWTLLPSSVTSTTGCCFCFGSVSSFFLELFLHWSPVAYWTSTNLESSSFTVLSFSLFICSWGSQGRNTEVVWHSLLQWTMFSQYSPPRPIHLGWPYLAWLIVALSWTRLWSMSSVWLVFCDCGFHSVCPLTGKVKRLMEASMGETDWRGNWVLFFWVGPCSVNLS